MSLRALLSKAAHSEPITGVIRRIDGGCQQGQANRMR